MDNLPPTKVKKGSTTNFRLTAEEKQMETVLRDAGADISLMYRNCLRSAYCAFMGKGNDWNDHE